MEERRERPVSRHAERDWITGLATGKAARERLMEGALPCAVLAIGLAGFRHVNVAHGREGGDRALMDVGERIQRVLRIADMDHPFVARSGGAEFVIMLQDQASAAHAPVLAQQLIAELNRPIEYETRGMHLSPRIGIAQTRSGEMPEQLMRRVRMALEEAMQGDTRTIVQSEAGRLDEALLDETLGRHLRHAIDRNEIAILLQPQFALNDGRMTGAEALARWDHPQFGTFGGEALFAAAARSNFVLPLSRYIQRQAIAMAAQWPSALGHIRLSINVTAQDMASPDMADMLLDVVKQSGFRPECLTVEITESALIAELGAASKQFQTLREHGLKIALDDFGTGYSSLAYLSALPLDYLKLDKSLTSDLQGSPRDRIVVRAVIAMAKALDLEVIAEGIETEAQRQLIEREGCDYWQGFLNAGALGEDAFAQYIEDQQAARAD